MISFNKKMGIKLDKNQRKELAKALYDIGKLVLTALVVGQFISSVLFRLTVFIIGLLIFIAAFVVATSLNKEGE
jgi:hypothetical protein